MSWIRSAVNKAVEVGGSSNLTRVVRGYADSVVSQAGQAVAGGARLLHDRLAARNLQSFKHAVKILEEISVSYRGLERVRLLRRWLVSLKEVERLTAVEDELLSPDKYSDASSTLSPDSPTTPLMVLYYDTDHGGEPMNFRDVFLLSQALEGITLNMILEPPNEEEVTLLRQIFGLCLMGGKEVHDATLRYINELAKLFSVYEDEILAKREELLQYAQGAIAGLKINAKIVRIDSEISNVHQNLDEKSAMLTSSEGNEQRPEPRTVETEEALKESLAQVQLCSKLQGLLLEKKNLNNGDNPTIHAKKVDKLKVLAESLSSSVAKAEKRLSDQRCQKEDALKYRVAKTKEISLNEKDFEVEVEVLEKQVNELEIELSKVKDLLGFAQARLHNAREERDQFHEASNDIILHIRMKEVELSRSVSSYRIEENVCHAFAKFLEESWRYQSTFNEQKMKQVNADMKQYEEFFLNLAIHILSTYKYELDKSMSNISDILEKLKRTAAFVNDSQMDTTNPRKKLEEEYLNAEVQLITMFSIVESIKEQFDAQDMSRKNDPKVKELFEALNKLASDFESIERPILEVETPRERKTTPFEQRTSKSMPVSPKMPRMERSVSTNDITQDSPKVKPIKKSLSINLRLNAAEAQQRCVSPSVKGTKALEAKLSKLKMEMELDEHNDGYCTDEIGDWEFDDFDHK